MFPLLFGVLLKDNVHYKHFLKLISIFFSLNAVSFDEAGIVKIEERIFEYLTEYKLLYPDEPIRAKFHYMIHYGRAIRLYGPCSQYSTIRWESKHSTFKQYSRAIHNHKNLGKSLAVKHQNSQVYHLTSAKYWSHIELGTFEIVFVAVQKVYADLLNNTEIEFYKWVTFENITYHLKDMICFENKKNSLPIFGQIKHLIVVDLKLIFVLTVFKTITYLEHFTAYSISPSLK